MLRILSRVIYLACLVAALLSPAAANQSSGITINADQQFEFAQYLYESRQFRRAAEEYQRFAYFFPHDPRHRTALFNAGDAFLKAGEPTIALSRFKSLIDHDELDAIAIDSHFKIANCYLQMNSSGQAVVQLHNLIALSENPEVIDRAYYRIGWIYLDQLDWSGAQRAFDRISSAGRDQYRVAELITAIGQADQLPRKSPGAAGTLSIVPGAGQLYLGRYEDALIAFGVNLGLFWAAYESFDNDLNALGALLTFVGIGFYAGNIYGAVSGAHKYNRTQAQQYANQLKQQFTLGIRPGSRGAMDGIHLSLHFRF